MGTISYFQAMLLGLIQGLAEFLPISSSGHLSILQHFFGIEGESVMMFTIMLHIGTLASVFICYWSDIVDLIKELIAVIKDIFAGRGLRVNLNDTRKLGFMIIVATIPTAVMGYFLNDFFNGLYTSMLFIGCALIVTGCLLMVADKIGSGNKPPKKIKFRSAFFVGIMQGFALCPGISRSGSTLFGSLITGTERKFAVKFCFLMSIPPILGSLILELPAAIHQGINPSAIGPIIAGMLVAALSGIFAIKFMIKIVSSAKLSYFSYYVWAMGLFVILWTLFVE